MPKMNTAGRPGELPACILITPERLRVSVMRAKMKT
jgi:hypothetical protein